MKIQNCSFPRLCATAFFALACNISFPYALHASLIDEIQVYTDDINAPGEVGLELHANTTPRGRSSAEYPGEVVPNHGTRLTPELSWGLSRDVEAGFYVPTNIDAAGRSSVAGAKLRLKWLPVRGDEKTGGWFGGANAEVSRLERKYSESQSSFELRIMAGYRVEDYIVAVNPVFGWNISPGFRSGTADVSLGVKAGRKIGEGISLGAEYYSDLGTTAHVNSFARQANTLFAAIDIDRKPWVFNFGLGFGLTGAADKYTLKAIFEIPF